MSRADDTSKRLTTVLGRVTDLNKDKEKSLLNAYIKGIQMIYEYFDELYGELFIDTMCSFGLESYERLTDTDSSLALDEKRSQIINAVSSGTRVREVGELRRFLSKISTECTMSSQNYIMYLNHYNRHGLDALSAIGRFIRLFVPAGVYVLTRGTGLTVSEWESAGKTFYELDSYNCPFTVYDNF